MGCICSKAGPKTDNHGSNEKEKESYKPSVAPIYPMKRDGAALSKREEVSYHVADVSAHKGSRRGGQTIISVVGPSEREDRKRAVHDNVTSSIHRRKSTTDMRMKGGAPVSRIISLPNSVPAEPVVSGWPSWLSSVAGDAIKGWAPRPADTFEKLEKIGQGTYSSVYKARDLETGKTVAMKKVRFVNMDPESVRFMAREIYILRRLDHPNVMKLECIVTSRMSGSLYLVFEYMEHDLAGLFANRSIKFTESQIKCYIQQLFRGLEHCHKNGVLHRDIKGSNLLIGNNGILKIGDFGLATLFEPDKSQPLTSRVVTLWYRAPELLLGATEYGVGVDLWSTGCILAELFSGKPIMPGRTEVEQMHKIFKLCGSPSDKYWKTSKLPHATSFKSQHPYKRCVSETFRDFPHAALALVDKLLAISPEDRGSSTLALASEFFMTPPLPCDPSSLPKYPPSKEFDAKMRDEIRRQRTGGGRGLESIRRGTVDIKEVPTPEFTHGQTNFRSSNVSGFDSQRPRGGAPRVLSQSSSTVHPVAVHSSWSKTRDTDERGPVQTFSSSRNMAQAKSQISRHISAKAPKDAPVLSQLNPAPSANYSSTTNGIAGVEGHVPRKNRIHYSGPLMPPGGNMDDMLREHERQIQEAVRRARVEKVRPKNLGGPHDDNKGFLLLPMRGGHQ